MPASFWFPARHRRASTLPPPLPPPPDPAAWAAKTLRFTPDPLQSEILRCPSPRIIACCPRQWGKSTLFATKALHHAWFTPAAQVLILSRTLRQSAEFLRKVRQFLPALGATPAGDGANPHSLALPNRSRLIALPNVPSNIVGFTNTSLLIIDEAAKVPDELYTYARPFVIQTQGHIWLLSTPHGQTGFFYDEWHDRRRPWTRFHISAEACPRYRAEALAQERLTLGDALFRQEYLCEFVPLGPQLLDRTLLDEALDPTLQPLFDGKNQWS